MIRTVHYPRDTYLQLLRLKAQAWSGWPTYLPLSAVLRDIEMNQTAARMDARR